MSFISRHPRCVRPAPGFSLVEVVLALAICTFAILAIVALLPAGIQSTRDSVEESQAINVLSEVISDRQATPLNQVSMVYQLPAFTNSMTSPVTNSFGITDDNQFSIPLTHARYRVDYIVNPPVTGRLDPYQAWLKVSWPAQSVTPSGMVEGVVTFPQP
jgi:type II secretory pathway pseudopilin PulG